MRIQTLTLKNFRSHQETVLELDRFNFIRGPNGCGKSSIQMALEFLFTGRCELTDAAGRGAESLIRSGEKELEVSATLASAEMICRRRTQRSQIVEINGKRVPVDNAETFLTKQFGSADVLSAVLNADRFVEMPEAEQQRFLAQLVEAGRIDIPKEIGDALRAINEELPKLGSVADVEAAHQRFYDLRTEANRALKALGLMQKPEVPPDLPGVADVRKKLEELRQQKERLIAQKAETDACWQNAQARLKQVQAEIGEASADILSPSEEQGLLQQESQRAHAEKLRQELTDLTAEQRIVEKALAAAQGLKDKCLTCGQPISPAAKSKEIETLSERLADLEGLIQGTREELNEYGDPEAATCRLDAHRRALARRAKLIEEQSKVQEVQKPDASDLESRMTILVERINKGDRVLEKAQQVPALQEKWETQAREKSSLEARIGLLDRFVEFFGPNGAMMAQASDRIGSFAESLNMRLAAFGYACNFTLDPFEIRVISSPDDHSGFSLKQVSESERFRFSIAFQLALATATGIRFVVIDRADVLDKERRKLLTALLSHSDIDQAIVLATSEEALPSLVPAGVTFLSLRGSMKHDQAAVSTVA
ncbi:MAG: AAA family ATPase [Candidatus Acidiferrales bacterium]